MKEEKMNSSRVIIYGQPYQLKGAASNAHILEVAEWVDLKMNEIGSKNPNLDHTRIAVLSALNIADELIRVRKELEQLYEMIDTESKGEKGSS